MKMSLSQMITIVCILAVGFVSIAPFFSQDAYAGVWSYYRECYKVYSFATGEFLYYDVEYQEVQYNNHYTYYHYPGNSTTAWEHAQAYGQWGHDTYYLNNILGERWE